MLEAAMFGLPYAGRMPDFASMPGRGGGGGYFGGGGAQRSVDPDVLEGRMLREEQEIAFQESLEVRLGSYLLALLLLTYFDAVGLLGRVCTSRVSICLQLGVQWPESSMSQLV